MLLLGLMAAEVVIGLIAGSLALLADAAHLLTDAVALVLALLAMRVAARPASGGFTYGWRRTEILSAQANGLTLLALGVWLGIESVRRLIHPPPVAGAAVLATALAGVAVNLVAVWAISHANRASLNIEGAFQHVLTDLFAFVATAVAGAVVLLTGFRQADAIASLVVVALMVRSGVSLVLQSGLIFLETAPAGLDPAALGRELAGLDGVVELHDLHVWQVTPEYPALSAHVLVAPERDCHAVRRAIEVRLREAYAIEHTTLQVDHADEHDSPAAHGSDVHGSEAHGSEAHGSEAHGSEARGSDPHCADPHGASYRPTPLTG
jgi:cobalt-zinc-cadmium efflux system protein